MQFTYVTRWLGYDSSSPSSNPSKRQVDWSNTLNFEMTGGGDKINRTIPAGTSKVIFDNTVTTSTAANTVFTWTQSSVEATTYRIAYDSGTQPEFRTDRGLTNDTQTLDFLVNNNGTVTVTGPAFAFTGVQIGDTMFFPGPTTGDPSTPVNTLNQGFWVVIGGDLDETVQIRRPADQAFVGIAESVIITDDEQVQAFSSDGVQVGDTVELFGNFPATLVNNYQITQVTPNWIEVFSSDALPTEATSEVSATNALAIYNAPVQFIRIESDQKVTVTVNSTSDRKIRPIQDQNGWLEACEVIYSLEITNTSSVPANVVILEVD